MSIGEKLKELRENAGYNKREIAEKLNMPYTTYNNYETDAREAGSDTLKNLAKLYGVSIDYILENEYSSGYYMNPEAAEMAQKMYERPEMRVLFDASRKATKEDIEQVADILKKLSESNRR